MIYTNYFERSFTKKELKNQYKAGQLETKEDDSDKNGELKRWTNFWCNFEKVLFVLCLVALYVAHQYYFTPWLKDNCYEYHEYWRQDEKFRDTKRQGHFINYAVWF